MTGTGDKDSNLQQPATDIPPISFHPGQPLALAFAAKDEQQSCFATLFTRGGAAVPARPAELQIVQRWLIVDRGDKKKSPVDRLAQYVEIFKDGVVEWEDIRFEGKNDDLKDLPEGAEDPLVMTRIQYSIVDLVCLLLPLLTASDKDDPFALPGGFTADLVRYIRWHHVEMVEGWKERFQGSTHPDHSAEYWPTVQRLVVMGCLQEAWELLSLHSLYQAACRANDENAQPSSSYTPQVRAQMAEIRKGFFEIKDLLLRAPIPGGRTNSYDRLNASQRAQEMATDLPTDMNHTTALQEVLSVGYHDYQLWETDFNSKISTNLDTPLLYSAHTAQQRHEAWKNVVQSYDFVLARQIPPVVENVLSILAGRPLPRHQEYGWPEHFLADLLYRQPSIRPKQLGPRMRVLQEQCGSSQQVPIWQQALVPLLQGEVQSGLSMLASTGASSGAALPATLVSSEMLEILSHWCAFRCALTHWFLS